MKKNNPIIIILIIIVFIFIAKQKGFMGAVTPGASLYEYLSIADGGQMPICPVGCNEAGAQTFTIGTTGPNENMEITDVLLSLKKNGNPTGTATIEIEETTSEMPNGNVLTSATIDVSALSTGFNWETITYTSGNRQLSAGTTYAIVVRYPQGDSSNYLAMQASYTGSYEGGGRLNYYNGGWHFIGNSDNAFEVWGITIGCIEDWTCTDWSSCVGGVQTRTCTDNNNCGTAINKPSESQICGAVDCSVIKQELGNKVLEWVQNQIDRDVLGNKIMEWVNC